jgi:glycosyltransferase involved in cell wall biosynthesis
MKKKVGILFRNDENWIGGTYYILNLIHAINLLPKDDKPEVNLICSAEKDFLFVKEETKYPFLKKFIYTAGDISKQNVFRKIVTKKRFRKMDCVFPYPFRDDDGFKCVNRKLFWIGDFQEKYLPEFFSDKALKNRQEINEKIASNPSLVVFSSEMALADFSRFYPDNKCETFLLQFAVTHSDISDLNAQEVLKKYNIQTPYFISPNQFWAHKNHECVIRAVHSIVQEGKQITLLFTGKEFDYRYPEYTNKMKDIVKELKLEEHIHFLGFIDRKEQLVLMKNSKAIIQPSLFEGWSTVVEDAKCLNKHIVLSNLPVHREQNPPSVSWFDPLSFSSLANALTDLNATNYNFDYTINKQKYANQFKLIIS